VNRLTKFWVQCCKLPADVLKQLVIQLPNPAGLEFVQECFLTEVSFNVFHGTLDIAELLILVHFLDHLHHLRLRILDYT